MQVLMVDGSYRLRLEPPAKCQLESLTLDACAARASLATLCERLPLLSTLRLASCPVLTEMRPEGMRPEEVEEVQAALPLVAVAPLSWDERLASYAWRYHDQVAARAVRSEDRRGRNTGMANPLYFLTRMLDRHFLPTVCAAALGARLLLGGPAA